MIFLRFAGKFIRRNYNIFRTTVLLIVFDPAFLFAPSASWLTPYRITRSARACTLGGIFRFWIFDRGFWIVQSSDNFVSSGENIVRYDQAYLFGGFQVDDKLKFLRLLDGKVSGLGAL